MRCGESVLVYFLLPGYESDSVVTECVSVGQVKLTGKIADNYNIKKDHTSIILYNKPALVV